MAELVLGIFEEVLRAESALRDLESSGFRKEDVFFTSNESRAHAGPSGAGAARASDVAPVLENWGIPSSDARAYADEVRQGHALVSLRAKDAAEAERAAEILRRHAAGRTAPAATKPHHVPPAGTVRPSGAKLRDTEKTVIPVVEEELRVGKREVERSRVRIYPHVKEVPVERDVTLKDERVTVERRPANRPAGEGDFPEGTSIEVREKSEEPVVAKDSRVVEEVVVGKEEREHTEKIRDKVRKTDVKVEGAEDPDEGEHGHRDRTKP